MKRAFKRVAIVIGWAVAALLALGVVAYAFGGPARPTREVRAEYDALVAAGEAQAVKQPFVVPIPGCRCHSDDPEAIVTHATYRMRDCSDCH